VAWPRLELADVVRAHRSRLVAHRDGRIAAAERRVLDDIVACRTAARGGHVERCDACGHLKVAYNSCRNRHCPKCQEIARARWTDEREREVLPVEYFHVVFTLPHELAPIALQNKKRLYAILFRAAAESLTAIASDPKHLGAEIGFLAVLHTWGQTLEAHPHVHCLIPGGGLSADGSRWVACRPGFFLPVRVLSRLFRGKFLHHLKSAHATLAFHGQLEPLRSVTAFRSYLRPLARRDWVVYAKPPFGGPAQVLRYLARYTHRVAISNHRLVSLTGDHVTFNWKDYRHGGARRTLTLDGVEFMRRFLLHILPKGFMRVRHYGFLANRCRHAKLDRCRALLAAVPPPPAAPLDEATGTEPLRCPACHRGRMTCVLVFASGDPFALVARPRALDSS
jgi:putative transposase/transposase-like zinc-binding protein